MIKLTKTEQKYHNMVTELGRVWQEQEIISFRSFLRRSKNSEVTKQLLSLFNVALEQQDFKLAIEQQNKGIERLRRTQLKRNGDIRQAKNTFIGQREKEVIDNYSHFTFVGLNNIGMYFNFYVPIYKCFSKDGTSFEYSTSPQGKCEVLG